MQFRKNKKILKSEIIASIAFMGCAFFQKSISFITTPIFTRIMSKSEYGEFNVYLSWSQLIFIVCTLSLSTGSYMTGLVKYDDDRDGYSASLLILSSLSLLVFFVISIFFCLHINSFLNVDTKLFPIMIFDAFWVNAFQYWSRKERVENRFLKLVIVTVITSFFAPFIGIALIRKNIFTNNMYARVWSIVVVDFFAYSFLFIKIILHASKGMLKYWKDSLSFNISLIPHYLSQIVLNHSDRIMINTMIGADEAGVYSLGYSISMVLLLICDSINKTLDPWLLKHIKEGKMREIEKMSYRLFLLVGLVVISFVCLVPEMIMIFAPSSYYAAIYVIPPVSLGVYFIFMYNFFADFEFYFGESKYITIASLVGAMVNIFLNMIFIPIYGFIAAGYTTLICYLIYVLMHYIFMRKVQIKNSISSVYNLKIIAFISVLISVGTFAMMFLFELRIIRYSILIFFGVVVGYIWKKQIKLK